MNSFHSGARALSTYVKKPMPSSSATRRSVVLPAYLVTKKTTTTMRTFSWGRGFS